MRRFVILLPVLAFAAAAAAAAGCAAPTSEKSSLPVSKDKDDDQKKPGGNEIDGDPTQPTEVGEEQKPNKPEGLVAFAHTKDTLYSLEATSRKATEVGKFKCLTGSDRVVDIAVDGDGKVYATTDEHFISVDPKTADCTVLGTTATKYTYPNSLSFVPAGTLDSSKEILVGYGYDDVTTLRERYVKIDVATGKMSSVGGLNPPGTTTYYESSGDLIALTNDGNRAYLTVTPAAGGTDRLAEIDPKTGAIKRIVGDTGKSNLYGLAYWAGTAYGFSGDGKAYSIDMDNAAATEVTLAGGEGALWFGAGVTTRAPTK